MSELKSCPATKPIQIGNQIPQVAHCVREVHPASEQHKAMVLDSDDNWIWERWTGDYRTGGLKAGDLVVMPTDREWGPGRITSDEDVDGKVSVRKQDTGVVYDDQPARLFRRVREN